MFTLDTLFTSTFIIQARGQLREPKAINVIMRCAVVRNPERRAWHRLHGLEGEGADEVSNLWFPFTCNEAQSSGPSNSEDICLVNILNMLDNY